MTLWVYGLVAIPVCGMPTTSPETFAADTNHMRRSA